MAKFTEVSNSKLCPGVTKTLKDWYVDAVQDFASKYANKSTITIPANCEKWEGHVKNGNDRLDLQGSENGYGNIQAQFGTGHTSCKKGGSYGGVLLACGVPFSIGDVQTALLQSLNSNGKKLVQLDVDEKPVDIVPPANKASKTKPGKKPWTPDTTYE